ncbi:MAG: hypothetical protein KDN19_01680 [Verrucomicrobiae bacterium]|nr:hypothetical protein [Verrucomicrobiae bacterium]
MKSGEESWSWLFEVLAGESKGSVAQRESCDADAWAEFFSGRRAGSKTEIIEATDNILCWIAFLKMGLNLPSDEMRNRCATALFRVAASASVALGEAYRKSPEALKEIAATRSEAPLIPFQIEDELNEWLEHICLGLETKGPDRPLYRSEKGTPSYLAARRGRALFRLISRHRNSSWPEYTPEIGCLKRRVIRDRSELKEVIDNHGWRSASRYLPRTPRRISSSEFKLWWQVAKAIRSEHEKMRQRNGRKKAGRKDLDHVLLNWSREKEAESATRAGDRLDDQLKVGIKAAIPKNWT